MSKPIEGRIAGIVDERTVIINRGAAAGVREGMRFVIFVEADSVKDPDTGEALGAWEIVKGRIRAAHVQDNMAVCAAGWAEDESAKDSSRTLSAAMIEVSFDKGGPDSKLAVRSSDMTGRPKVGPVAVGDRVRSVES